MNIQSVGIRRRGTEDDPNAEVICSVQMPNGQWIDVITEKIDGNFSHNVDLNLTVDIEP